MLYNVALVYHPRFQMHSTGFGHPEHQGRIDAILTALEHAEYRRWLTPLTPLPAPMDLVETVHPRKHLFELQRKCAKGERLVDSGDTVVSLASFETALLAAGAVVTGVDFVMNGNQRRAFCPVRPPGHHAETARAMGFCLLNNIAIGARYARRRYGIGRIAILDWDVHHGNGTQEIFTEDRSILFVSLHQSPLWPDTGSVIERGDSKSRIVNIPLPPSTGDEEWMKAFTEQAVPELEEFAPELILISAGFDAHRNDPLANMNLSTDTFAEMTRIVGEISEKFCGGRIVSVLEGGYQLNNLARDVEAHVKGLACA